MTIGEIRELTERLQDLLDHYTRHSQLKQLDRLEEDLAQADDIYRELGIAMRDARMDLNAKLRNAPQSSGTQIGGP